MRPFPPHRRPRSSCAASPRRSSLPHQRYSTLKERALHPFRARTLRRAAARSSDVSLDDRRRASSSASSAATGRARARCSSASRGSTSPTAGRSTSAAGCRRSSSSASASTRELTARENVLINAVMLGLSRARGPRALRRDHRLRRARGVHRPPAQELLVGHAACGWRSRSRSRSTPTSCSSTRCSPSATPPSSRSASSSSSSSSAAGKTIVLVTHDMSAVERFCHRAMLIERGDVLEIGEPRRDRAPLQRAQLRPARPHARPRRAATATTRAAEILDAWFEDDGGERITEQAQGEPVHDLHGGRVPRARSTTRSSRST